MNHRNLKIHLFSIVCCLGVFFVSRTADANTVGYYIYDNIERTVTSMVNNSGNVVSEYSYDCFGEAHAKLENTANFYKYNGEYYDSEVELIFLRNRYYNAKIGRFVTKDAFSGFIVDSQSLNPYVYVGNNPINLIDPLGLWNLDVGYTGTIPAATKVKPSVNVGFKIGSEGIYGYFGSGYGAGKGLSITFSPTDPSNSTKLNLTARGGIPISGIPVGAKIIGNVGNAGLSGDFKIGYGIGAGFGISVGATTTYGKTWDQIGEGIKNIFSNLPIQGGWPEFTSTAYASEISPSNFGGVSLSKTAQFLLDLSEVKGAVYDDKTGQIILVGKQNLSLPQMKLPDLSEKAGRQFTQHYVLQTIAQQILFFVK